MNTPQDATYMRRALRLARKAWGRCSPNPMVGALVVSPSGEVVGQGYHHQAGCPHAEPLALDDAGPKANGATLFVTLEPCSTWGRTPPCTERILASGVRRVVIGCLDSNPAHAGAAVKLLQDKGIEVTSGILETECRQLNEAFFWWITHKRPFVCLKMAMTLDGRIATENGASQWITGPAARRRVQKLRRWCDAIMVGGNTACLDNPSLLVREPRHWPRQPQRLIWTSRLNLPSHLVMCSDGGPTPRLVKPTTITSWMDLLCSLGQENVTALLLEGGGELAANALQCGIVNKLVFFVAPKILCGRNSRPVVGGPSPLSLDNAISVSNLTATRVGDDWMMTGYPKCHK